MTWQNYDNTILKTDTVNKGEIPEYHGETPTKETDETYVYEFIGWSEEIQEITKDTTYTALFKATRYYHVTFLDYDNTSLYESIVLEGELPSYQGNNPIREEDDVFSYEFNGWSPEITSIDENIKYIATYTATRIIYYHVTFLNYDSSVLYEVDVKEGRATSYLGETPTKPEDDEFTYEFERWDQDYSSVTSDLFIKAIYKPINKEPWGPIII